MINRFFKSISYAANEITKVVPTMNMVKKMKLLYMWQTEINNV